MEKGRASLSLSGNWRLKCYIRVALWKCITFFHTALSTLSKATLLQCYENTSRGVFDLCAFECDFQCPLHLSVLLLDITSLPSSPTFPGSEWPLSNQPLSNTQHQDETHWEHLRSEGKRQKYIYFFFENALPSYAGTNSNAKHVNEWHLLYAGKNALSMQLPYVI